MLSTIHELRFSTMYFFKISRDSDDRFKDVSDPCDANTNYITESRECKVVSNDV